MLAALVAGSWSVSPHRLCPSAALSKLRGAPVRGLRRAVGVESLKILVCSLMAQPDTRLEHWLADGKKLFNDRRTFKDLDLSLLRLTCTLLQDFRRCCAATATKKRTQRREKLADAFKRVILYSLLGRAGPFEKSVA
jgi:hypothetical protein